MIIEIPTADEFHTAGLNLLHLAWRVASVTIFDAEWLADNQTDEARFWGVVQPELANALGLIEQGMELALKARIARVSPYLLIGRDPKNWPSGADSRPVPFSDFHSIDAADLIKVHDAVAVEPLHASFRQFFDGVRRERNVLMHSVPRNNYDAAGLIHTILAAAEYLYGDKAWTERLLANELKNTQAYLGGRSEGGEHNAAMRAVHMAVRVLRPAQVKHYFGFDTRRRAYLCPGCYERADRDLVVEDWEKLAQLMSKERSETRLWCAVCREEYAVERTQCKSKECRGNVLFEGLCLTCVWPQDEVEKYPDML